MCHMGPCASCPCGKHRNFYQSSGRFRLTHLPAVEIRAKHLNCWIPHLNPNLFLSPPPAHAASLASQAPPASRSTPLPGRRSSPGSAWRTFAFTLGRGALPTSVSLLAPAHRRTPCAPPGLVLHRGPAPCRRPAIPPAVAVAPSRGPRAPPHIAQWPYADRAIAAPSCCHTTGQCPFLWLCGCPRPRPNRHLTR